MSWHIPLRQKMTPRVQRAWWNALGHALGHALGIRRKVCTIHILNSYRFNLTRCVKDDASRWRSALRQRNDASCVTGIAEKLIIPPRGHCDESWAQTWLPGASSQVAVPDLQHAQLDSNEGYLQGQVQPTVKACPAWGMPWNWFFLSSRSGGGSTRETSVTESVI